LPGSQQTSNDGNSWANMVKRGTEKAPSVINNGTNNVTISPNVEARQVSDLPSRSFDQDVQNKQDPMTVEHHLCPPADEADLTLSDDINKTDNIVRMEEEQSLAPPDTHATCPNAMKWADLITTESDDERDHDKQGKKREKSKQTKDDKQEDKESDDNTTDAGTPQLTQTTNSKRSKKNQSRQRYFDGTRKNKKSIETENAMSILTVQLQT